MKYKIKKREYTLIVLIVLLLLLMIVGIAVAIHFMNSDSEDVGGSADASHVSQTSSDNTSSLVSEPNTSSDIQSSDIVSSEDEVSQPSSESSSTESKPKPEPKPEPEPEPIIKTDANEILEKVLSDMVLLKGDSAKVEDISNPAKFTVEVDDTADVDTAASEIFEAIKSKLKYNEATADGTVASGNPNPFSYDYKITFKDLENGKYEFTVEYRYRQFYDVTDKGYNTNRLVEDVIAYLTDNGKIKFDYQTSDGILESQPVIIPLEDDYAVALEKAKGHVISVCSSYRNFDFAYKALTVAGRDQNEKPALMFYIYCK